MKKVFRILGFTLALVTLFLCISAFASGITYPCGHSYAEAYTQPSSKTAIARTKNSQASSQVIAQVKGTYRINGGNAVGFAGPRNDGSGTITSTYTCSGSGTVTFPTCYNYYIITCSQCGAFSGAV